MITFTWLEEASKKISAAQTNRNKPYKNKHGLSSICQDIKELMLEVKIGPTKFIQCFSYHEQHMVQK